MKSYVCITAGEWRNLCSMGRIRLQEVRTISSAEQPSPEFYDQLFSSAADRFLLGETSDFLITEYRCLRSEIEGIRPPGYEIGIRWLLLQDVVQFFPLRADDAWAFEVDAKKAQVALGAASFETQWHRWFEDQIVDQACINGLTLRRAIGFQPCPNSPEAGPAPWSALARRIVSPDSVDAASFDFSSSLLSSRDRLFDLVREDADSGAFFVSCPIEWINLRADSNIFDSDAALADQAQLLHQKYLSVPFEASLANEEDIKEFGTLLITKSPDAFPGAWCPALISLYVRYSHRLRFGSVTPDDIVTAIRAIDTPSDRSAAEMLAFLLGVALGSNKTHSLERTLDPQRFETVGLSLDPEIPNQDPAQVEVNRSLAEQGANLPSEVKISRISDSDFRGMSGELHIVTYAECGFSPLDIHSRRLGLDSEQVSAFAKAVNDHADVGSLHPRAPISAVPRDLIRERQDADALAESICKFFKVNRETIKARRIVFDFRVPSVPSFAMEALITALNSDRELSLDEVFVLEM